jgi:hypothetical protein
MKPKFRAFIHGVNFHIRDGDTQQVEPLGFYVTAFVEAHSAEDAELAAVALLRDAPKLRGQVLNTPEDPPRMFVEEIEELSEWPADCVHPLSGFAFYNDPDEDWRNEPKSANA